MTDNKRQTQSASVDDLPLQGRTVLITRPKEQAEEFSTMLRDRGAKVEFMPTIEIVPTQSWEKCDAAIEGIRKYDGMIFTSANAVRAFFRRLRDRKQTITMTCYVVGSSTGNALEAEGLKPTTFPGVRNSRELAEALLKAPLRGKTLLFPKGNLASEEAAELLRSAGATIDEVIVYDTVVPRDADDKAIREKLQNDSIDIVTFFSASSVKLLLAVISKDFLSSKTIAVIGASTAEAVRELGLPVHILPERPKTADLVDAIVRHNHTNEREVL